VALSAGVFAMLQQVKGQPSTVTPGYKCEVTIAVDGAYRTITANGIPNHKVGHFPGPGNPNAISPQDYHFKIPVVPTVAKERTRGVIMFGVAVNGIPFDPATAELWNGDMGWHYEALTGFMAARGSLGADTNYGHVQPTGAYHYHGLPMGLMTQLDYTRKVALVGWAADGYPIYGPYGYSDPMNPKSALILLRSGYKLKEGNRPGGDDGPDGAYDGSFRQDFEWKDGVGDLDEFNGRFGVTPDFPKGTFYYVLTDTFPFIPRKFKGVPDASFRHGPPARGR